MSFRRCRLEPNTPERSRKPQASDGEGATMSSSDASSCKTKFSLISSPESSQTLFKASSVGNESSAGDQTLELELVSLSKTFNPNNLPCKANDCKDEKSEADDDSDSLIESRTFVRKRRISTLEVVPKVLNKQMITIIENLSTNKQLTSVAIDNANGDVLYVDDRGRKVQRLRITRERGNNAAVFSKQAFNAKIASLRVGNLKQVQIQTVHETFAKSGRIGAVCCLNFNKHHGHERLAFTQGVTALKIFDLKNNRISQHIDVKRRLVTRSKETEIFRSSLCETVDGSLIVGFSGSFALYVYKANQHGRYHLDRTISLPNRILCFTYNPVLELIALVFYRSSACPLILDKKYEDYTYLRIYDRGEKHIITIAQILILDRGIILLNDWRPPSKVEVFNMEGYKIGCLQMPQVMVTAWSIKRTIEPDSEEIHKTVKLMKHFSRIALKLSRSKKMDKQDDLADSPNTTKKDAPVDSSHSTIYLYDLALSSLIELVLDM